MNKVLKITIAGLLMIGLFSFISLKVKAQTCNSEDECRRLIQDYEQKLSTLRQTKNTLSSQIEFANTQIYLTTLRIQETENKIVQTQKEIENLGQRIDGLNKSLDILSRVLLAEISENYKNRQDVSFLHVLFDSDNASGLINKLKYMRTSQENNSRIAFRVQQAKLNFEEQKTLREDKKIELDKLTTILNEQKANLDTQKAQKQKLLADTQSSETTYQRLLAQAQAQLAGFKSFVQSSGAASVIGAGSLGSGSDGSYYSQRDERWANQIIGASSDPTDTILNVGCLISSVAMVAKHYGDNQTPSSIAADSGRFWGNTAYMRLPWPSVAGRSYHGGVNIDEELAAGNYVIVGVGGCANGGSHFVVLTKKDGDSYIMHDPIYGPDIKFSDHYSNICTAATFK